MNGAAEVGSAAAREWTRGEHTVSDDRARLDFGVIHGFLTTSYWSPGISMEDVRKSAEHSHPFGLYRGTRQVGFARVLTDYVKFAYLCDVFVLEGERGNGVGRWMMECILAHPDLAPVRKWMLATWDAHGFYQRLGFAPPARPEMYLERYTAADPSAVPASLDSAPSLDPASAAPASPEASADVEKPSIARPVVEEVEMGGEAPCQLHRFFDPDDD